MGGERERGREEEESSDEEEGGKTGRVFFSFFQPRLFSFLSHSSFSSLCKKIVLWLEEWDAFYTAHA